MLFKTRGRTLLGVGIAVLFTVAPALVPADLAGLTLTGGVYRGGTMGLSGAVTLDAQGDPGTVFVFQAASTLITASASHVNLVNGAQACNVFWQVGTSATLGTASVFAGNILALTSISLSNGVTLSGRALARNGGVTLINDTIVAAHCATSGGGGSGGGGGGGGGGSTGGGSGGNGTGVLTTGPPSVIRRGGAAVDAWGRPRAQACASTLSIAGGARRRGCAAFGCAGLFNGLLRRGPLRAASRGARAG
jgi:hypothetical protein